jgi:hypothetical protein
MSARFAMRVADEALSAVKEWPGWTVVDFRTAPDGSAAWLVQVYDPSAPDDIEGRLCCPAFERSGDEVRLVDYCPEPRRA